MSEKHKVSDKIIRWLNREGYVIKLHGEAAQVRGLPDIIACVRGQFVAIESKLPGLQPSAIQRYHLEQIAAAGGRTLVAHSLEEAQEWAENIELLLPETVDL